MEFSNGEIHVWIKNPNLDISNPAEIPLCLSLLLNIFPIVNEPVESVNTLRWIIYDPDNLMEKVILFILRTVKPCQRCKRDISKISIIEKST